MYACYDFCKHATGHLPQISKSLLLVTQLFCPRLEDGTLILASEWKTNQQNQYRVNGGLTPHEHYANHIVVAAALLYLGPNPELKLSKEEYQMLLTPKRFLCVVCLTHCNRTITVHHQGPALRESRTRS